MAASTINRTYVGRDDDGTGAYGTMVDVAYIGLAIYDQIDALFTSFGEHNYSGGGTGANSFSIRNTTAGTSNRAEMWLGTDESPYVGTWTAYSSTYTTSGANFQSGVKLSADFDGGLSLVASHASGDVRIYSRNKLIATFADEQATYVKDSYGANAIYNNDTNPVFIEFYRTSHTARGNVGVLGTPEMNVSFNMDYSDNSHKFYDSSLNAFWIALGDLGMTLQFAPAGASGDIWTTAGNAFLNVSATGTLSVAENVGVLSGRRFSLDGTRAAPQDAPSFSGSDTYIIESVGNTMSFFAGGVESKLVSGVLTVGGAGTHTFSAGATGGNILALRNTTSGTGNYSQIWLGTNEAAFVGVFSAFSSAFTTSGPSVASGVRVSADYAGGLSLSATHASGAIRFYANGTTLRGQINAGWEIGAPTGGDKGAGTINAAGDIYKNNSAYTNPDYVFEHYYTGAIERFAQNEGASEYGGLLPLTELEAYVRTHFRFPMISDRPMGAFARADITLLLAEQLALYLFDHERRLSMVEQPATAA